MTTRAAPGRRREVLTVLRDAPSPMSIAAIAERLGVHQNTVRFHLDSLVGTAQVERVDAAPVGPGRPPMVFQARRGMDPAGPRNYRMLAEALARSLDTGPNPVAKATAAGRAWGKVLVDAQVGAASSRRPSRAWAVGELVELLDDLGFAPEQRSTGTRDQIGLRHCPFLELVETNARVVCPLHLGLMQGAMSALGSSMTVERLDAFVEPDLCVAHLGTAKP